MIRNYWPRPMLVWAARDILRKPVESALLTIVLIMITASVSMLLLIGEVLSETSKHLLQQAPALVVRRVNAGGWAPLPVAEALSCVRKVPGVIDPRPRVWGVADSPLGTVTVVGSPEHSLPPWPDKLVRPGRGEAVVGPGLADRLEGSRLLLSGERSLLLSIVGRLPDNSSMATHDLVITHPVDARRLLGLLPHQASDLAIDVYHPQEAEALCTDLSYAMPWPVSITTRAQTMSLSLRKTAQWTGRRLLAFLPAVLALIALSAAIGVWGHRRRPQNGLYKALGWTNADLLRLQTARCMLVALPSLALGCAIAYLMLFGPGSRWLSALVLGWSGLEGPMLNLSAKGTAVGFVQAAIVVGLPFLLVGAWSGWHSATTDPGDLLQAQPWGE